MFWVVMVLSIGRWVSVVISTCVLGLDRLAKISIELGQVRRPARAVVLDQRDLKARADCGFACVIAPCAISDSRGGGFCVRIDTWLAAQSLPALARRRGFQRIQPVLLI